MIKQKSLFFIYIMESVSLKVQCIPAVAWLKVQFHILSTLTKSSHLLVEIHAIKNLGSSWSHKLTMQTNRKLCGLKVTSM